MEDGVRVEILTWALLAFGTCALVPCCLHKKIEVAEGHKVKQRLGERVAAVIERAKRVDVFKAEPDWTAGQPCVKATEEKPLPDELIWLLQKLILSDHFYLFNKTKMCLFIPELGFRIQGESEVLVLLSFSCRQIKVVSPDQVAVLDIDPNTQVFDSNFRELLTRF